MKAKIINRDLLRALRAEIDAAVAKIASKHGITMQTGNARFTAQSFTFKLEGALLGAPKIEESLWKLYAPAYGLDLDMLHREVRYGNRTFTVVGFKKGGRSVLLESAGKQYRAPSARFAASAQRAY